MWTVVYMSANVDALTQICNLLRQNSILTRIHEISGEENEENAFFEILVPDAEVCQSQEIIFESEV